MRKTVLLWTMAFLLTLASAVYQRVTGPTYPVSGRVTLAGKPVPFKLARSHGGKSNQPVQVNTGNPGITGELLWRRYRSGDMWKRIPMQYHDGALTGELPWQPPSGKLEYRIELAEAGEKVSIPAAGAAVTRFKGDVPAGVLILHVGAMFGGMLLSTRTGLEFLRPSRNLRRLTVWTIVFLVAGGVLLGPLVQKFAFGAYWTGWPFGTDLTDNKTAVAVAGWVAVYFALNRSRRPQLWAALAAVLVLTVFMIPHSVLGSELDYNKTEPPPAVTQPAM